MTARPMSEERCATLAALTALVQDRAAKPASAAWSATESTALELIMLLLRDEPASRAALRLACRRAEGFSVTVGSRTYPIRTVDDLRTYLEREVPEPRR